MFILCYYLCRLFLLTLQIYGDFQQIPRKISDSFPTCVDKRPIFGQIAETGQKVVQKIGRYCFFYYICSVISTEFKHYWNKQKQVSTTI
jgi:hypothetical protein